MGVSTRTVEYCMEIQKRGVPELLAMIEAGSLSVHHAVLVARLPHEDQLTIVAGGPEAVRREAPRLRSEAGRRRVAASGEVHLDLQVVGNLDGVARKMIDKLGPRAARVLVSRIVAGLAEDRVTMRAMTCSSHTAAGRPAGVGR